MNEKNKEILFSLILIIIVAVLLYYNVFSVETKKIEEKIIEKQAEIERLELEAKKIELLKQQREKESVEIIEFDEKYRMMEDDFLKKVKEISDKSEDKFVNIEELKKLIAQRLKISKEFNKKFIQIDNIPEPLNDFYKFEIEFLNNDIEIFTLMYSYYNSGYYYAYNDDRLKEIYRKNNLLFLKAEKERVRVYKEYRLDYLLEDAF
mgnify:CR=1 FL=1